MAKFATINVTALTADWKFEIREGGSSGFRRYMSNLNNTILPDVDVELLPAIGDSWDDNFQGCKVVRIEMRYMADNPNCNYTPEEDICCPKIYDVFYESIVVNTQAVVNEVGEGVILLPKDLPFTMETSAEYISVQPEPESMDGGLTGFKWFETDLAVEQPIYFTVSNQEIKVRRVILDLENFLAVEALVKGKINMTEFFYNDPGTVLYLGSRIENFRAEDDTIKYNVELSFTVRKVTYVPYSSAPGTAETYPDGWNYILKEKRRDFTDKLWDAPYRVGDEGATVFQWLYTAGDFEALMRAGGEDVRFPKLEDVEQ